ncbi:DUF4203 domain-containing protein [bacterium]|nr:DUF4203 domain-containing protein [bacterium]
MQFIGAIIYILIGLILLLFGYKLFNGSIFLLGFLVGAICGVLILATFTMSLIFLILGALIGGLLGAMIFKFAKIAVFIILGGLLGAMLGQMLYQSLSQFPQWIVITAFTIIFAILAVLLRKPAVIAASALVGATLLVMGVVQIITEIDAISAIKSGNITQNNAIIILVASLIGAAIQVTTKKKK